ncbi:N-acetyl-gamma-glutamyl-phosphate reductase [Shumkonia mesophila]|uniref:N-acetyl-gamma-glutamyl-phosphate reductase n=1 Tax=Shumkonia mesophila TaxID=2838854 RepID=UPI0029345BA2|nr:N-acetyl-gamma-glutamyl-phosphate reductase [Shumkonia mesophila]
MTPKVFIDGEVGTTGLQIRARLAGRKDVALVSLPEAERKDTARRRDAMNAADLVILCLPDDASREAVTLIDNPATRVVDASSAHRVADGWVYGMPEYDAGQRAAIAQAKRVTNPGCYAITAVSMLHPLVAAGLVPADFPVTINAISGYSGGGKKMIASFENKAAPDYTEVPFRVYALGLEHKHTEEIRKWGGLDHRPLFVPSVGRFRQGMIVQVPLQLWALPGAVTSEAVHAALAAHYAGQRFVRVAALEETAAMSGLEPEAVNGTNELRLHVFGNARREQAVVVGLIDNLGKGASGQAVQNVNLMLGLTEEAGLDGVVNPAY